MKFDHRDPAALRPHQILKWIPEPSEDSHDLLSAADTIRECGPIHPIVIDDAGEILDDSSRLRWMAAKRMQLRSVPVLVHRQGELIPLIALSALIGRPHYTRSALAYLAVPLLKPAFDAARTARVENLKNAEKSSIVHSVHYRQTADEFAEALGICRRLLFSARQVRAEFEKDRKRYQFTLEGGPDDGREVALTLQEYFEPRILRQPIGGEHESHRPLGLGAVIAGIASIRKTKGGPKANATQLLLFERGLKDFGKRFRYWSDLDDAQRRQLRPKLQEWAQNMPDDLFEELQKARRASSRKEPS
jgi:hypothetical protein